MRRALLLASGANRGAYYAGFLRRFQDEGIDFELMAGISAGGIAAAWFAAGDADALIDSWRQADPWRIALHPWLAFGKRRTVDRLIQHITLQTMDVEAARTAKCEVRVGTARIVGGGFPLPKVEFRVFSNRGAMSRNQFGMMLRATAFVPWINGFRSSIEIAGEHYLDGGLVHRVPFSMVPENRFDELWVAACSPNGLQELEQEIAQSGRKERLVVVTPSRELPVARWTMEWSKIGRAIELGAHDISAVIDAYQKGSERALI